MKYWHLRLSRVKGQPFSTGNLTVCGRFAGVLVGVGRPGSQKHQNLRCAGVEKGVTLVKLVGSEILVQIDPYTGVTRAFRKGN